MIPLRNREVFKTAIPSKMFEAMAAGKPAILGVKGEAKEILLDCRAGLAVQPEDPDDMTAAILALQKEPSLCRALGRNGRQAVLEKYLRATQANKYLNLLRDLCSTGLLPSRQPRRLREVPGSWQWAVGSRQPAVGSSQWAVDNRQSALGGGRSAVGSKQ